MKSLKNPLSVREGVYILGLGSLCERDRGGVAPYLGQVSLSAPCNATTLYGMVVMTIGTLRDMSWHARPQGALNAAWLPCCGMPVFTFHLMRRVLSQAKPPLRHAQPPRLSDRDYPCLACSDLSASRGVRQFLTGTCCLVALAFGAHGLASIV